jgi:hypothetical protein
MNENFLHFNQNGPKIVSKTTGHLLKHFIEAACVVWSELKLDNTFHPD